MEELEGQHQQVMKFVVDEAGKALGSGDEGLALLKALPMIMTTKYQELASKFVVKMRGHLAQNVPKFDDVLKK